MYNVSTEYKEQINNKVRNPSHMRVKFGITDPDAISDMSLSDTSSVAFSDVTGIKHDTNVDLYYDTLEHNQFILDSAHELATESYGRYQAYVSGYMSDENCEFQNKPQVIVDYTEEFKFAGLSLTFDSIRGDYCSEINLKCYSGLSVVHDATYYPNESFFTIKDSLPLHDKAILTFNKSSLPYKRVRLQYMTFGLTKIVTDDVIVNTTQHRKVDLMSTVLPKGDFNFTFLDINGEYDPDNPDGLFKYLEELQPVKFEYGYELDSGLIEWQQGGQNFTSGEVSVDSSGKIGKVTFKTNNSLSYLNEQFITGVYPSAPVSLYDLAESLMSGTGIQYDFDSSLHSITTNSPLPNKPVKELLQLISNAGRCVLDVDREGKVVMYKRNSIVEDFHYDFGNMTTPPRTKKYPPLRNVNASFYTYNVDTSASELLNTSVVAPTQREMYLEYDMSTEHSISVTGTLVVIGTPTYYSAGCVVNLSGTGDVSISGKKITVSESTISKNYNANGEDCYIKNELITSETDASHYSDFIANVLQMKNEYSFNDRGFPEVDMVDKVYLDTLFSTNLEMYVTEIKMTYNGTLKSTTTGLV